MPQLNPSPWFMAMLISWLALMILMTKIINLPTTLPLTPTTQKPKPTKTAWAWPWH